MELTEEEFEQYNAIMHACHHWMLLCADAMRDLAGPEFNDGQKMLAHVRMFVRKLTLTIAYSGRIDSIWIAEQTIPNSLKPELLSIALAYEVSTEDNPYEGKH